MKIQIVKNKYVNSLLVLMLFSAIVHMVLLFFLAIWKGDLYFLNYFNILSISYLIPDFLNSALGNAVSLIFVIIIYLTILKFNKIN